jgi:hypothetical protein
MERRRRAGEAQEPRTEALRSDGGGRKGGQAWAQRVPQIRLRDERRTSLKQFAGSLLRRNLFIFPSVTKLTLQSR